jgi:nucleoside-diphosphate-sugar epimerase
MRVLVTGGTGFLGRHLVRALLRRQLAVRALGRDAAACAALRADGVEVARADLRDTAAVLAACDGVNAVIHAGALSAPWGAAADFHAVNVAGTGHVLAACRAHGVARLVHVSSPSVTFRGRDVVDQTEAAPYPPSYLSHYSHSKMLAEKLVRSSGVPAVIVRPKALFGPGDSTLLPRLLEAARRGRLPQLGAGANRVDLTYVENVAHALVLALEAPAAVGRTYVITNGEHVPLWGLVRLVLRRVGLDDRLRRLPYGLVYLMAGLMEARARLLGGEPTLTRYSVAVLGRTQTYDISAARRDLGYAPLVSVAEGVERTLATLTAGGA